MLECLIIGDSIAYGISQYRIECQSYAKIGISTKQWNKVYNPDGNFKFSNKTTIISLGSNDISKIETYDELMKLRDTIDAERVFWVLPKNKPYVAHYIVDIEPVKSRCSKTGCPEDGSS